MVSPAISASRNRRGAHRRGPFVGLVFGLRLSSPALPSRSRPCCSTCGLPDVYEGAPTPVTAFFAAAPKVAAMAMLVRIVIDAQPVVADWQQVIVFISIASMLLGSFAAIGQKNIKRLMAYSSIGHMGYALVGLASGPMAACAALRSTCSSTWS